MKTINEISHSVLKKELYRWRDELDSSCDFSWVPKNLVSSLKAAGFDPNEVKSDSRKLSTALLLLTLLFDEARMNCARAIDKGNLMKTIIELLSVSKPRVANIIFKIFLPFIFTGRRLRNQIYSH